ncbi:CerR family C-terminal domain-containing protein [Parahaliea mediterranea]|uniref:CerR family C-terminal domain-containing protein n=1 Tax=Parahaliea mediterranea TaxID=651086 RepID=UPI000E2E8E66|nr:CerR family C-terminal domain-containing protein [Parahaliea mediterranea]
MPKQASAFATSQSRGEESRARILQAALGIFGREGFAQATTRRIADAAEVALPAIKYYFDNKEGLYLACAREIVRRYEAGVGSFVAEVGQALADGMSSGEARESLKQVMRRVSAVTGDDADADLRTGFVLRELTEQGPAFEVLYQQLWQPGVAITARLIARIEGKAKPDGAAHTQALMLHASMTAFSTTRPVSLRYLKDNKVSATRKASGVAAALSALEAQIDRMGG